MILDRTTVVSVAYELALSWDTVQTIAVDATSKLLAADTTRFEDVRAIGVGESTAEAHRGSAGDGFVTVIYCYPSALDRGSMFVVATRLGQVTVEGALVESSDGYGFGLHHVQLSMPAGEEDVGRRFYIDVLGMSEVQKPAALAARGGFWVRAEALELHLGVEKGFRPALKAHPGILVSDIDRLADHLIASGVPVEWDDNFPFRRRFYASDCWGNRLEFLGPTAGAASQA